MSAPLLSLRKVSKVYPSGTEALKNVSFEVDSGEFLVIIGLSGSGKSTLLRLLNRLTDPTSGEIFFKGERIDLAHGQKARAVRRQIAMIFQHFNLVARHSVLSNVLMGRLATTPNWKSMLGQFSREDQASALEYLRLVGIESKAHVRADRLSGGEQQRVAIARAINQNPTVLLADEPVASLDPATAHTVMDYLRRVNRDLGITVVCNLHFLSLVREYATRVIALRRGEIVFNGPPAEIDKTWFKTIYGEEAREVHVE